ncbi:MAG: hypothetical protein V4507_14075 [Verrucomicrobiota bacterium]
MSQKHRNAVDDSIRPFFFILVLLGGMLSVSSLRCETPSPDVILKRANEKYSAIRKEMESWQYTQSVKNWTEESPGEKSGQEEYLMKVRPRTQTSFKILGPEGKWIHGGTPDDDLAKRGRKYQKNMEMSTLTALMERFDFKGIGEEKKENQAAYKFHLTPKATFDPQTRVETVLKAAEGDLWVSLDDYSVIQVEGTLIKPTQVAWMFATVYDLKLVYKTIALPIGRVMSDFNLELTVEVVGTRSKRFRQVKMTDFKNNPGQDIW